MSEFPVWLDQPIPSLDKNILNQAREHQKQLTKPAGSLGRLEEIAIQLAAMQGKLKPALEKINITIFAADHGIADAGVSAFPQVVTGEMIRNFVNGGAAISVLAKSLGATLSVIDLGTVNDIGELKGVVRKRIAPSTRNFLHMPAMDSEQYIMALNTGRESVEKAIKQQADIFVAGEMGIANTTSATAIACALLNKPASELVGPGTGLDEAGKQHKAAVIDEAIARHADELISVHAILQRLGGFEIVALVGAYIYAAQQKLPVCIDGFITTVAALAAVHLNRSCQKWFIFSHQSAEPGHIKILQAMNAQPLLNLGMRLGEGSGAAVAIPLLQNAVALHNGMATFTQASVTDRD